MNHESLKSRLIAKPDVLKADHGFKPIKPILSRRKKVRNYLFENII